MGAAAGPAVPLGRLAPPTRPSRLGAAVLPWAPRPSPAPFYGTAGLAPAAALRGHPATAGLAGATGIATTGIATTRSATARAWRCHQG